MHKNRITKILINVGLVVMMVLASITFGYQLTERGECMEKVVDGKKEKVCVRNRLHGWPSEVNVLKSTGS